MLSDDDKAKIREEEIFRQEIRESLTAGKGESVWHRFWAIANKPITIWFLATIIVGVASWTFDYVNQARKLSTSEKKLDLEIASRLINARVFYLPDDYLVSHISHSRPIEQIEQEIRRGDLKDLFRDSHGAFDRFQAALDSGTPYGAFPEFKQKSLASLIWELATLRGEAPSGALKEALDAAVELKLKRIFWQNRTNFTNVDMRTFKRVKEEHETVRAQLKSLSLKRWSLGYAFDAFAFDPTLHQPDLKPAK